MSNFRFYNIQYKQNKTQDGVVVTGEVVNEAQRDFNCVAFRLILYVKTISVASVVFTINGFSRGQNRDFEVLIPELSPQMLKEITAHEIVTESAY